MCEMPLLFNVKFQEKRDKNSVVISENMVSATFFLAVGGSKGRYFPLYNRALAEVEKGHNFCGNICE
jgi:hypothetical protein